MACPDPTMQQENDYLAALASVNSFTLTGAQLTLDYDDGRLIFTAADEAANNTAAPEPDEESQTAVPPTPEARPEGSSELQGTSWVLTTFGPNDNQTAVLPDTELTLNFDGEQINGSAGCNSYFADVTIEDDGTLSVGLVGSTLMACMDEGVMQQESNFLAALAQATSYSLSGNRLTLHTENGSLAFVAATTHETGTEGAEVVDWETAVSILNSGEVVEIFQTHSLDVTLTLADGRVIKTVEPAIDDIFTAVEDCGEPCSNVLLATE
jgi:heat shock protein HslJ